MDDKDRACGRTQGWSLGGWGGLRSRDHGLTCSNTTHSGIWSSAWRPLRYSRRSGASPELRPPGRPACRFQPTWGRSQEDQDGPAGRRAEALRDLPFFVLCTQVTSATPWTLPLCLLTKILLREAEHVLKLVLGNSLPFALVLSLQPVPDFRDLKEWNGGREEGAGRVGHGPKRSTF